MADGPTILHLDLDAFFASVEQRDKPSLRGKPVIVGGISNRGVVSTASYEARKYGVHSAMSTARAHHLCPKGAFLAGRFKAYRQSSKIVMSILRQLSEFVEPVSIDEAYVDLSELSLSATQLEMLLSDLRAEVEKQTEGLTASVGIGSSKFMAKIASEMAKPNGIKIVADEDELDIVRSLPVRAIPGVGPVVEQKLALLSIKTGADLQQASKNELVRELGQVWGSSLAELAFARDPRRVLSSREVKSFSTENTFQVDLTDREQIATFIEKDAAKIARRLLKAKIFARTITLKIKFADFVIFSRSRTITGATASAEQISAIAKALLKGLDLVRGVRLVGVSASGFTAAAQEALISDDSDFVDEEPLISAGEIVTAASEWLPGIDVIHEQYGRGWVWGSGLERVTVRFEYRHSPIGAVRTFGIFDKQLQIVDPLPLAAIQSIESYEDE